MRSLSSLEAVNEIEEEAHQSIEDLDDPPEELLRSSMLNEVQIGNIDSDDDDSSWNRTDSVRKKKTEYEKFAQKFYSTQLVGF